MDSGNSPYSRFESRLKYKIDVRLPISSGIVPLRLFWKRCKRFRFFIPHRVRGMGPESLFVERSNCVRFSKLPISEGIGPDTKARKVRLEQEPSSKGIVEFNLLELRSSFWSFVNWPKEDGILFSNEFAHNSKVSRSERNPILSGIGPFNLLVPKRRFMSLESLEMFGDNGPWNELFVRLFTDKSRKVKFLQSCIKPGNLKVSELFARLRCLNNGIAKNLDQSGESNLLQLRLRYRSSGNRPSSEGMLPLKFSSDTMPAPSQATEVQLQRLLMFSTDQDSRDVGE
ncbi:Alpha-2-macroglobulin [Gossypium arboreum]|uniref:Alpha-2-macroglobulin n=1 Tax=Gossypium arboreum TaxID=29729 RepID=A0A0B0PUI4_GOSAR|nr:Alpha-2-macroglobulin [Gossypium arboreum]